MRGELERESPATLKTAALMSHDVILFLATFLASAVEAVEALTIVLAVGVVRGWRSTLIGVGAATIVLAAVVAALGPALQHIPIETLRFVVGGLLLAFGLQWLRKAILRASGFKPLHDEAEAFLRERARGRRGSGRRLGPDRLVLVHGRVQGRAARGAGSRLHRRHLRRDAGPASALRPRPRRRPVSSWSLRAWSVRGPLERVPENTLKFVVGVLLTSFGIFWGGEGAGVEWPGGDSRSSSSSATSASSRSSSYACSAGDGLRTSLQGARA